MTMQEILDRLTAIEHRANNGNGDDVDAIADDIAALKLDIEIDCRRAGVPFV